MAKGDVEPNECRVARVEAQTHAHRGLEFAEVQHAAAGEHLAGVHKRGAVQPGEDLPAVLCVHHHHVAVVKAEGPVTAQIVRTAEKGLEVERNGFAPVGFGDDGFGAQRDDVRLIEKRNVLLQVGVETAELAPGTTSASPGTPPQRVTGPKVL